jgi:hypothetical protein
VIVLLSEDEREQVVDGVAYIVPFAEPFASFIWRFRSMALAGYVRWDAWGLGVQLLGSGLAVQVGPFMLATVHVQRFLRSMREAA